jgi:hypothetical protein
MRIYGLILSESKVFSREERAFAASSALFGVFMGLARIEYRTVN